MWSALMNGGGGGGGYVPSQGWEFVPCARMDRLDRGRRRSHSPLRRISSPPTVFSQLCEPQFDAVEGDPETQFEVLRGQMWPGPEPQQQQQTQHGRLKKKLEDLKKRHVQDKEGWMREKESLLREMADIQGGENRRILLDMKAVLEEVKLEVKREEEKRSELQLQYTRDKCSWEVEKAELKRRIAQLEARERGGSIVGGGQLAPRAQEKLGETPTLRREREEQRRLLEDTRSTAMDLRCRLELSERDWSREKADLLERFDVERREWESQLKDMQRKIEELYCEVRAEREETSRRQNHEVANQLSIRSTGTGSSSLSDNSRSDPSSGSSRSGTARITSLLGCARSRNVGRAEGSGAGHPTCFQEDHLSRYINAGGQKEHSEHELIESGSMETWQQLSVTESTDVGDILHEAPGYGVDLTIGSSNSGETDHGGVRQSSPRSEPSYGSEKKRSTTALNAALKEIARVSKELCSYQDEIRKKSGDRRNHCEALCLQEDNGDLCYRVKTVLEVEDALCDFSQIYNDCVELEREKWLTLSSENTWRTDRSSSRGTPSILTELDEAPPIPPRTSSWNLSTCVQPETELHIPESPLPTMRKCHSPCSLLDRKCSSPSIVRKFGAMLQENEGKILIDGLVASCSVPANAKCHSGCCHNRWSCDASKLTDRKAADAHVQKSFSEVNILTARKDLHAGCGAQLPPSVKDLPLDLLLSSLETSPASLQKQGSKRNITLEQKTAEFNRTLFQAEMGRGVGEQDGYAATDARPGGCQPSDEVLPPRETKVPPGPANVAAVKSEATPLLAASDSTGRDGGRGPDVVRAGLSCEQPPIVSREASAVPCPADICPEVKPVRAASSPLRKSRHRPATEALFSTETIQPGQNEDNSSSKSESPGEAKPQAARGGVSLPQLSVDSQQRQMSQPRHVSSPPSQSDGARPAPRMLNDHPWKPLTLAAYPRPEGSRSNYGALEWILKNYESAARAQENQSQRREASLSPSASVQKGETITELGMLDMDPPPSPLTLKHTHAQLGSYSSVCGTVQPDEEASSALKNFLRPTRPANRRLPSRWARASPTTTTTSSSDSASSSPSTTPAPPPYPLHALGSPFLSRSLQMETVII